MCATAANEEIRECWNFTGYCTPGEDAGSGIDPCPCVGRTIGFTCVYEGSCPTPAGRRGRSSECYCGR